MIHPSDMMRSYIIDMETLNLAQQAGMFCESLRGIDVSAFEDAKFYYDADEPYAVHFIWDKEDMRIQFSFKADEDDSVWMVSRGRRRFRSPIGNDRDKACREFLEAVKEVIQS